MSYNNYNGLMNQLYRQKDNIENMIAQYSQGMMNQQAPVQNIINTSNSSDTEIKMVNKDEDINNIIVTKKTLFIDEYRNKISIKEIDGTISKTYDIIIPKDEKDLKIEELENKLKELEGRINDKSTSTDVSNNDVKSTTTSNIKSTKSATVTTF
jgi:hypothetical protein